MHEAQKNCEVKIWGNLIVSSEVNAVRAASGRNLKNSFTFQLNSLYRSADGQLSSYPLGKEFPSWVSPFLLKVWEERLGSPQNFA